MTRFPERKKLPHEIPSWVPDNAFYFITINCKDPSTNVLAQRDVAETLLGTVNVYEKDGTWEVATMMIMPNHVHLIAAFSRERGITNTISSWKRYIARQHGVKWQAGFFEHRLRNQAEHDEKLSYVLQNPLRADLVTRLRDWPYWYGRGDWSNEPFW